VKKINIIFLLFFITFSVFSKNVIIKGAATDYVDEILTISKYSDMITFTAEELSSTKVTSEGSFEFNFELNDTTLSFINIGVYKGFIILEPGKTYEIELPAKREKKTEDYLNPYFKQQEFYFTIKNSTENDLCTNLNKFDKYYNIALFQIFRTSYAKYQKSKVDSVINIIDTNFVDYKNSYFDNYKYYRYATLRTTAYMRDKETICKKFLFKQKILYNNIAYMDFFNETFSKCFSSSFSLIDWDIIRVGIAKQSLSSINNSLAIKPMFVDKNFRHLVIIKGLYDLFYSDTVNKESVLAILDSLQSVASLENKNIINNFWQQATKLMLGKTVPFFELKDADNKLINIKEFEGSFVYLNFYHPDSYVCKRQVDLLKSLNSYKVDMLKIVTVFVSDDIQDMKDFIKTNNCDWTFLYYDKNNQILEDYKVVVYPTYYLISPEGKLISSPAKTPEEDFEHDYNNIYLDWKNANLKKGKDGKMLKP